MDVKEAKNVLIAIVLSQPGLDCSGDYKESISRLVHQGNFFATGAGQRLDKFFTWEEDTIDGKLHIYVNNLWIHPVNRNKNSLLFVRKFLKTLYPNVYKGYWWNTKRELIKYRS